MKKVEDLTTEELKKERGLYRKTLVPIYLVMMVVTLYAIWTTNFSNEAIILFWIWIIASLPVTLRSSRVHRALKVVE